MSKTRTVKVGDLAVGAGSLTVIAGPCSIESKDQFTRIAQAVNQNGAQILRGGIFKLRTRPDTFQGLGHSAYDLVKQVKSSLNMPFISEVTDPRQIGDLMDIVDVFQVGSRNMHNYALLKELGLTKKPVLLKRGFSGLIDEWVHAADYIQQGGNDQVILCERGIRTFENKTRNTMDINAIAWVKQNTDYPIIADPSHGTGVRELVEPIALAAIAAGADGLMVEVHDEPEKALSDGFQALTLKDFEQLMSKANRLKQALQE